MLKKENNNQIKVLLVQTVEPLAALEETDTPLGLAYIAGYLRKYLKHVDIRISSSNSKINFSEFDPDIVGISSVSQNFNIAKEMSEKIKKIKNIPLVIGGHHITSLPHLLTKNMDVAVLGEGEETFLEIVKLVNEKKFSKDTLKNVKGIAFMDKGKLVQTPAREFIKPLDNIPFPARDLLKNPGAHIVSSRGCPYRCVFCSSAHFWKIIRFFSPEYVVKEIELLIKEYGAKEILIWDDLFIANKERVREIVKLIKNKGINKKVSFSILARANLVNDDICALLKEMNVTHAMCGFETGSPKTLEYLKKGTVTIEQNQRAVDLFKKYGFKFTGTFIIGSPQETAEDIKMTLEFIKKNDFDEKGDVYLLTPLPGTPLWQYAKEKSLVSEDENMDWGKLNIDFDVSREKAIIVSETLTRKQLWKLYMEIKNELEKKFAEEKSFKDLLSRFTLKDIIKTFIRKPRKSFSYAFKRIKLVLFKKL